MTNILKYGFLILATHHLCICVLLETPKDSFPNRGKLPHPCWIYYPESQWADLAHRFSNGDDVKDVFHEQFQQNNFIWSESFCKTDSDGDGMTNGEEVGDPFCEWKFGDGIKSSSKSHPGICEPVGSDQCVERNKEMKDKCFGIACPLINEPDVKSITITKRPTEISLLSNSFICETLNLQDFGLDVTKTYHVIAAQSILSRNSHVHHSVFVDLGSEHSPVNQPLSTTSCSTPLRLVLRVVPLVYHESACFQSTRGILIGKDGVKSLVLEVHFKNLHHIPNIIDTSALKLYYTENLREHSLGILALGLVDFAIPPEQPTYEVMSMCHSYCTATLFKSKVYVSSILNHMHTFGKYIKTEQYRNGRLVRVINEETYNWINVKTIKFKEPIEMQPGDELKVHCVYSTTGLDEAVQAGDNVDDEMCIAFMEVYPLENVTNHICSDMSRYCQSFKIK